MRKGGSRLAGADRRSAILAVAVRVFAEHGFSKAKIEWIADEAGVSPALVYRHFPSKISLFRAVLRRAIKGQDEGFRSFGIIEPSTRGLVRLIVQRMRIAVSPGPNLSDSFVRLTMGSLASDGSLVRFIYRRVARLSKPSLSVALSAAEAAGDSDGYLLSPEDALAFMEHVASSVQVSRSFDIPAIQYSGDDNALLKSLVMFCARGIGLRSDAVERYWPPSDRSAEAA